MIKADSTLRTSQAVPHPSTNRALCRLTSEVGRGPVHSTRYGRQRKSRNVCERLNLFMPDGYGAARCQRGARSRRETTSRDDDPRRAGTTRDDARRRETTIRDEPRRARRRSRQAETKRGDARRREERETTRDDARRRLERGRAAFWEAVGTQRQRGDDHRCHLPAAQWSP